MLNPVAMSIITNTFTDPKERAGAIGMWGAVVGISMSAGPALGGVLVTSAGWQSIFWINVPVGIVCVIGAVIALEESTSERRHALDIDCVQVPIRHGRIRVVTADFVRRCHAAGLPVHVWVVDEAEEIERLLDLGVEGVMTDRADVLAEVFTRRGLWPQR